MANLNLPKLDATQKIVNKDGTPNALFLLHWQRYGLQLTDSATGLEATVATVAQQQAVIVQLIGVIAENVVYLNQLWDWNTEYSDFVGQVIAQTRCQVAAIAADTGTDISGCPSTGPDPGPPPIPPWEEPPPEPGP